MLSTPVRVASLAVSPAARWCVAEARRISPGMAWKELRRHDGVQGNFAVIHTHMPAFRQTQFKVYLTGSELLVAAAAGKCDAGEGLEIHFDPLHDHVGYQQFLFDAGGTQTFTHLPYAEAASSTFPRIRLLEHEWGTASTRNVVGVPEQSNFLFARFTLEGNFLAGDCCGFNMARYTPSLLEPSSWNHCTGSSLPDASGYGHLWRTTPDVVTVDDARVEDGCLYLTGTCSGTNLALTLADPHDDRHPVAVTWEGQRWQGEVALPALAGRYRLYPSLDGPCEPGCIFLDVPGERPPFVMSMTYDIPDDLRANYFDPERLATLLDAQRDIGISRVYWIEYPPYKDYPSLWRAVSDEKNTRQSFRRCGDLLTRATELCHERGMEIIAVYKPFDMGGFHIEGQRMTHNPARDGLVQDIDGHILCALPEVAARPERWMAANPAWVRTTDFPITRLRLYADAPLPPARAEQFQLWTSTDNGAYAPYTGPARFCQCEMRRAHQRWTPAGPVNLTGSRRQWVLEWDGLELKDTFLALTSESDPGCANLRFSFAEALDRGGQSAPILLTRTGTPETGFTFNNTWSWANLTEDATEYFTWRGGALGLAFTERASLPAMLEPSMPGAQRFWLREVARLLHAGVDGIDIRTLCQHYVCLSWLQYAFAAPVREAFRQQFGREVTATPEDYTRVRQLRGGFYTDFIRKAKALTARHGKLFAAHLEPGVEVPVTQNVRMAIEIQWERWLEQGLLDEITLKYWAAQSAFVHERVLPRARRAGIPVHLCDRNFSLNTPRAIELADTLTRDAHAAGFAGLNWYETNSYYMLNAEGYPVPYANNDDAIRRAADAVGVRKPRG